MSISIKTLCHECSNTSNKDDVFINTLFCDNCGRSINGNSRVCSDDKKLEDFVDNVIGLLTNMHDYCNEMALKNKDNFDDTIYHWWGRATGLEDAIDVIKTEFTLLNKKKQN